MIAPRDWAAEYAQYTKPKRKIHRKKGLCDCGRPTRPGPRSDSAGRGAVGTWQCIRCAGTRAEQQRKLKDAGICVQCFKKNNDGTRTCLNCLVKRRIQRQKRSEKEKEPQYKKQKGRCNGCRMRLPKRLLAWDHIHPRKPKDGSAPGTDAPKNMQLLCTPCNVAKGARSMKQAEKERVFDHLRK